MAAEIINLSEYKEKKRQELKIEAERILNFDPCTIVKDEEGIWSVVVLTGPDNYTNPPYIA